nr:ROK family protein [Desulfobacterales bacterium]
MTTSVVIGVDLGGTNTKLGVIDSRGKILIRRQFSTQTYTTGEALADALCRALYSLKNECERTNYHCKAIGLGVAGRLSADGVRFSPNVPQLNHFPLLTYLKEILRLSIAMDNDANCFGLGENWLGAGKDIRNWLGMTLGTGIGGCLILNNRLWHGDNLGMVGEIGHMVVYPHGAQCACGSIGCLEAVASGGGLVRAYQTGICQVKATPKDIYLAARSGDAFACRLFEEMGVALGIAISNAFNLLGIHTAVIGGGVSAAWELFISPLKKTLERVNHMLTGTKPDIRIAQLGADAALYGAAQLAWEISEK